MTRTNTFAIVVCLAGLFSFASAASGKSNDSPKATNTASVPSPADGTDYEAERALDLGQFKRAESIFTIALKQSSKSASDRPYLQMGLAEALLNQGKLLEAAREYKKARGLVEGANATDELKARLYDGLSWLAQMQGQLSEAQTLGKTALAIRKASTTASPSMFVQTLMHMGYILELKGQLEQSLPYYQEAAALQYKQAGQGSLIAADIDEKAGSILRRLGNSAAAQQCFQRSLQTKLSQNAPQTPYSPHAYWENVTLRFVDGSPNCVRKFDRGIEEELIAGNGVTVQASLVGQPVESTKSAEVRLMMRNDSNREVQFLPMPPALIILEPKLAIAPQVDPSKLAHTVEKKGDRKAAWIRFWGQDATKPVTTTFVGRPGFWGYPPIYSYGGAAPFVTRSGNLTTVVSQVPDYAAQARALAKAAAVSDRARRRATAITSSGLGPTTVPPGQAVSGSLYFDATKIAKAVLRVPIGNALFEFQFPSRSY
jgi:tetratricopeptide (TPR) repeat protein